MVISRGSSRASGSYARQQPFCGATRKKPKKRTVQQKLLLKIRLYGHFFRRARARASAITRAAACARARGSVHAGLRTRPAPFDSLDTNAWPGGRGELATLAPYQSQDVDPIKARMLNVEGNA